MRGYPYFSFRIPITLQCQDLLFPCSYKPCKNIFVLAGIPVKKSDFLGLSEDAQNGCAVAKVGTVLNPLVSPNSDQYQISPCNINAYSTPQVMRIEDMITQDEFS